MAQLFNEHENPYLSCHIHSFRLLVIEIYCENNPQDHPADHSGAGADLPFQAFYMMITIRGIKNILQDPSIARSTGIGLTAAAFICLVLGITLPCIRVSGHLFGFIPTGTDKRSILDLVGRILNTNILLALLILLFSILIPLTKLILTLVMIIWRKQGDNKTIRFLVHNIGKWSMVDVFSMAIIVTMMTFDNLRIKVFSTEGELLAGFYLFLAYGILTIATTYFLSGKNLTDP